jgi:hypothetical protein
MGKGDQNFSTRSRFIIACGSDDDGGCNDVKEEEQKYDEDNSWDVT